MSTKSLIFLGMFIGSIIGGYLPTLFGVSGLSYTTLFTSSIGALLGIWIGFKLGNS